MKHDRKFRKNKELDHEDEYEYGFHDNLINHRRDKKMKNAMRCKDINYLLDMDDDRY